MNKIAIEEKLAASGLLNHNTGFTLVRGIDGEDRLLARWREVIPGMDMRVERLYFNESRCYPIYP